MKRRHFIAGTLGSAAALTLAACTGKTEPGTGGSPGTVPSKPAEPVTLNFYTDKAAWEPSFEDMNKASAGQNMSLKFTGYSDPTAYDTFIKQSFRTKKIPDLFTWHTGSQTQELVEQGLIAETSALWSKAETDGLVPPGIKENYTIEDKQYGVPLNIAYWVMYYSKSVFDKHGLKPPSSFADLMAMADTLVAAGVTPFHQMNIIFEFVWFQALLMGSNPEVYDKLSRGEAKYTDDAVVKVAQQWSDMIGKKYFIDPGSTTDPQTLLKTGQVAMIYMGTFFTGQLTASEMTSGKDYGAFVFPNMDPSVTRPQMALETGPLLAGKGAANEAAALAYSEWWMSTEAQKAWSTSRGDISFNPEVPSDDPEIGPIVKDIADKGKNFQVHTRYLEATPNAIYTVASEVFGKLVTDGGDPMPGLQKIQAAADEYWSSK